ncbi:hypothetical protein C9939_00915 [Pseudidiomarina aestuarii]|nr:hypothetical protein C9939_00915 [Pseudidiomarina aestuarii]
MARLDLSDEEWAVIAPLLWVDGRGPKQRDDRTILNGIFYIIRTDAPRRAFREDMARLPRSIIAIPVGRTWHLARDIRGIGNGMRRCACRYR